MSLKIWWCHDNMLRELVVMHAFDGDASLSLCGQAVRVDELHVIGQIACVGCSLVARNCGNGDIEMFSSEREET